MHPLITVTINGRPISAGGFFMSQLISLDLTDKEGVGSDTLNLEFNASRFTAVPEQKDQIKVWLGYQETGTAFFGTFEVNDAELKCIPYTISVSAKAADMKSNLKTQQARHWDNKTVGDQIKDLAQEAGLQPVISGPGAEFMMTWNNMDNESALHFGERMARRHNALFDIKDGKMLFIDKGTGQTASGLEMPSLIIRPEMSVVGSCSTKFSGRDSHKEVEAQHYDKDKATREIVKAQANTKAEGTLRLRHAFGSKEEATSAAKSKAKDLERDAKTTSVEIVGNVMARGGSPMSYAGFHPQIDGVPFIIDTATHSYSKGAGYLTSISAKVKV